MGRWARLFEAVGINAVPIGGVLLAGWTPAVALALYWVENLVGSLLVAMRIALHRRWTGKRGHRRANLGSEIAGRGDRRPFRSFLSAFAVSSLVMTAAHGLFLALALTLVLREPLDGAALGTGLLAMIAVQVAGFLLDLPRIGSWSFAFLKQQARFVVGRVVIVHLTILGGMAYAVWRGEPQAFLTVFIVLKGLVQIGLVVGGQRPSLPAEAPELPFSLPARGLRAHLRASWERERAQAASDEEIDPSFRR